MYVRQFILGKLPFLISVHLKISALFVVSHFLSAQLSPEIIEVKTKPRFLDPEIMSVSSEQRSLVPLIEVINTKIMCTFSRSKFCVP